jgi:hypothetical protein
MIHFSILNENFKIFIYKAQSTSCLSNTDKNVFSYLSVSLVHSHLAEEHLCSFCFRGYMLLLYLIHHPSALYLLSLKHNGAENNLVMLKGR